MAGAGMMPLFATLMICTAALLAPWPVLGQRQSTSSEDDEQKLQQAPASSWEVHKLARKPEPGVFECVEEFASLGECIGDLFLTFNPRSRRGRQRPPHRGIGSACCDAIGGIEHSCLASFIKWAHLADDLDGDIDSAVFLLQKACEGLVS
ncbi:hypothetical protein ACLOJK_028498 [Asimina triloba]